MKITQSGKSNDVNYKTFQEDVNIERSHSSSSYYTNPTINIRNSELQSPSQNNYKDCHDKTFEKDGQRYSSVSSVSTNANHDSKNQNVNSGDQEKDVGGSIDNLTPDQAMEMLNSYKLKFIVYIVINLIYNFNTIFVAAIPFLIQDPQFECYNSDSQTYLACTKDQACTQGMLYKYNENKTYRNLVLALDLQCSNGVEVAIMTALAFGANWAGSLFFNVLGDKYGRLFISKIGFILACVEFTSSSNRDFYTIVAQSFDGLMGTFTVLIFAITKDFKNFVISGFIFGLVIMVLMFWLVPESPRYYIATGQNKKAIQVYKYLAKLHPDDKVKSRIALLEDKVTQGLQLQDDESDNTPFKEQCRYFIKNKTRLIQAVIISLCWFVNCFQNYGLNLELGKLQGDILINSAISNLTGFLACYLSYPVLLYSKRKPAQIIGFTITMFASGIYVFVESEGLQYFLLFLIKFGITLTFILIYCFTTELYPTEIRGLAFGLANTFGRLATIISALMVTVDAEVFMWINVGQSLLIIICTFGLSETKGLELADKIDNKSFEGGCKEDTRKSSDGKQGPEKYHQAPKDISDIDEVLYIDNQAKLL
eukprot:403364737